MNILQWTHLFNYTANWYEMQESGGNFPLPLDMRAG